MNDVGPTLRRRQLGVALERLRKAAGVSTATVASDLGCTEGKIRHIENGRNLPSKPDLEVMLRVYGASDQLEPLEAIRSGANERGWWSTYKLPAWMAAYIGLETDATGIRCFALELVPGLLQNYDYAKAAFLRQGTPADQVQRLAAARMERQRRLGTEQTLAVVLSEALLHRTLHMGEHGLAQLRWLVNAGGMQGVQIQVLPFATGGHRSMSGSFTLLDFPAGTAAPVAYQEYALGGHLADDPKLVGRLGELFEDLQHEALDVTASMGFIRAIVESTERNKR